MSAVIKHPRAVELIERRKLRKKIERAVSRLIAVLDELDTDPEAEPSLGAPELPAGANDDREREDEHGGDVLDQGEETLGWAANVRQLALGANTADGELTAPERHGMGFLRGGRDDMEEG